uniref:Uncharacterized protein n=1 Tax=Corethron hystrix TaxID=216773 RepID=A0A7S1BN31_9STRA|mmetsp:Transcript_32143/g.73954  ORF Transcript_32143/g.73954 Transcript_32143/m.73954 type:complete len:171 (+) Transcript_32143:153-665(+)
MDYSNFSSFINIFLAAWVVDFLYFTYGQCIIMWKSSADYEENRINNRSNVSTLFGALTNGFLCSICITSKLVCLTLGVSIYNNVDGEVFREVLHYFSIELDSIMRFCMLFAAILFAIQVLLFVFTYSDCASTSEEENDDHLRVALLETKNATMEPEFFVLTGLPAESNNL